MLTLIVLFISVVLPQSSGQEIPPETTGTYWYNFDNVEARMNAYSLSSDDPNFPSIEFGFGWIIMGSRTCDDINLGFSFINPPSPPNLLFGGNGSEIRFPTPVDSIEMKTAYNADFSDPDNSEVRAFDSDGNLLVADNDFSPITYVNCGGIGGVVTDYSSLKPKSIGPFSAGQKISRLEFQAREGVVIDDLIVNWGSQNATSDVRITDLKIGQTVLDPDFLPGSIIPLDAVDAQIGKDNVIDLVKGKSAALYVTGTVTPNSGISSVNLGVEIDGVLSTTILSAPVDQQGRFFRLISLDTQIGGLHSVRVKADPMNLILETNEQNNQSAVKTFNIYQTEPLGIGISPIRGCIVASNCFGTPSNNSLSQFLTAEQAQFLTDILPVADTGQLSLDLLSGIDGTRANQSQSSDWVSNGIVLDLINLEIQRLLTGKRKIVGFFDSTYTAYHSSGGAMNVAGNSGFVLFNRTLNVALVEVDDPNSLGHELIHLLGQEIDFYSDRSLLEVPPGVHWDGTGVNARTMQILSDKLPIMSGLSGNLADYWIDRNSYYKAFNTLIRPEVDPQIIILSGLIGKNGTLTSTRVVQSGSGLLTSNVEAGEILVKTLSASGATLNQVRVNLDYLISASGNKSTGPMVYELEAAPIVVSLPNSATVAKIQVSKGNSILYEHQMSAPTPTAAEIVSRIPIDGMNGKLQLHRQAQRALLLKTAKTIDSLLTKQQYKSAIVLLSVLKLEINLMVKRTYPVNGQEITRSQAIELIESMTRYYTTRK